MAGSVYWVGADNNIYLKAPTASGAWAVQRVGTQPANAFHLSDNGFSNGGVNINAQRINDPNPPQASGGGGGGGGGGTTYQPLNQSGVDNTQKTIGEIPGLLRDALAAEGTQYGNTTGQYDESQQVQQGQHDTGVVTNQQNYDRTYMDSIRAGIHGLAGVIALLRGTGAAGGTAEDLARQTVGGVTASDIQGGADTQKENKDALDASLGTFLTDLQRKRAEAQDTHANNEAAIRRDSETQLQKLYGTLAGYYSDAGDTGNATSWQNKAGALTHDIAANSRTKVTPYDKTPVVIHAPNLTAFSAPTQPNVLAPPSDGQVGSGIFTMSDTRRRKDTAPPPVAVPAGA